MLVPSPGKWGWLRCPGWLVVIELAITLQWAVCSSFGSLVYSVWPGNEGFLLLKRCSWIHQWWCFFSPISIGIKHLSPEQWGKAFLDSLSDSEHALVRSSLCLVLFLILYSKVLNESWILISSSVLALKPWTIHISNKTKCWCWQASTGKVMVSTAPPIKLGFWMWLYKLNISVCCVC